MTWVSRSEASWTSRPLPTRCCSGRSRSRTPAKAPWSSSTTRIACSSSAASAGRSWFRRTAWHGRCPRAASSTTKRRPTGCETAAAGSTSPSESRSRDAGWAFWRWPTRSRATGACSTSRPRMRVCSRSSPTRRRPPSKRHACTVPHWKRSASSGSSSSRRRSRSNSCRGICPWSPGLEIAAKNVPTRQVGGDYFDFFPLSGGRLAFLVSDVSGKGVPAALLVSTVHAAVHLQIDEAKTIADLIGRIDRHLQRFAGTRKFLTLLFRASRAGHQDATLRLRRPQSGAALAKVRRNREAQRDRRADGHVPELLVEGRGDLLSAGDLLCVYTDGVTEALNGAEEEFGLDRLEGILAKSGASSPDALCRTIFDEVDAFVADAPRVRRPDAAARPTRRLTRIIRGHPAETRASLRRNRRSKVPGCRDGSRLVRERDFSSRRGSATTAMPERIAEER